MSSNEHTEAPFAVIRTISKTPQASYIEVAQHVQDYGVEAAVVQAQAVNIVDGKLDASRGFVTSPQGEYAQVPASADSIRVIQRLGVSDRGLEDVVPWLNPDVAYGRTVDKLKMSDVLGDLAIPTRLLVAKSLSTDESRDRLQKAADTWGRLIIKKRSGQRGDGIFVGTAAELSGTLDAITADPEHSNYVIQPFLDSTEAYKPGLPAELQHNPTSLRVIGGVTQFPGGEPLAEIFTAFYRYNPTAGADYHGGDQGDEYVFLQRGNESIEKTYPELAAAFELTKQALLRGVIDSKESVARTSHGISTQLCSTDILMLPADSPYGFEQGGDAQYKPIIMEQNSASERIPVGEHDYTRTAWHKGEARMLASLALGEQIKEDR